MTQFNVIEAIKDRTSVRTYLPEVIKAETLEKLVKFMSQLTNPMGVKSVHIGLARRSDSDTGKLGTYGVISGADTFLTLSVGKGRADTIAGGYEMESLILYARSLGLGTVWLGGTFKRRQFAAITGGNSRGSLVAVAPVGYPAQRRFTERIMRMAVRSDKRRPWDELFFDNDLEHPLTPDAAGAMSEALEMVRLAPSGTNKQPWRIVRRGDSFDFYCDISPKAKELELVLRQLDMGIAFCHFDLAARSTGIQVEIALAEEFGGDAPNPELETSLRFVGSAKVTPKSK